MVPDRGGEPSGPRLLRPVLPGRARHLPVCEQYEDVGTPRLRRHTPVSGGQTSKLCHGESHTGEAKRLAQLPIYLYIMLKTRPKTY